MKKNMESYQKEYSEKKFWNKIKKCANIAGLKVTYVALLLYYVLSDPDVPTIDKAKIYGALGYFILPFDLIPDFIPFVGYSDDLAALAWATHAVWSNITPQMKERAKEQLHTWFGDVETEDLYTVVEQEQGFKVTVLGEFGHFVYMLNSTIPPFYTGAPFPHRQQ